MFIGVTCPSHNPIHSVCLSDLCKISPFLCSAPCQCKDSHELCNIKSLEHLDQDIKSVMKFQFFMVYSPTLKGSSIHVAGRFAMQTVSPPNNQRFCLAYDPIPRYSSESITFKLTRITGCVGVGVFIRQIVERNEFRYLPDHQYLNHGAYMIMSNNMLYSNTRSDQNGKLIKQISLKQNDIVKVHYQNQKAVFTSQNLHQTVNIDRKVGDHLHFGIYLYEMGDEVEILNTFVN